MYPPRTFLGELDEADRAAFLGSLKLRQVARDQTVLHEGVSDGRVIIVMRGRLKLVTRTPSGRAVLLGLRGPGELLGELSAFDGGARSAEAVAVEDVEAGFTTAATLRDFVKDHPGAATALVVTLVARLREADRRRLSLATGTAVSRVAHCLLDLAQTNAVNGHDGLRLEVPVTQEELGYWAGLSRQAVARALDEMRTAGWLTNQRHHVVLRDVEALRAVADR